MINVSFYPICKDKKKIPFICTTDGTFHRTPVKLDIRELTVSVFPYRSGSGGTAFTGSQPSRDLRTAFLQRSISAAVSSGYFPVPPLSIVFTILKPLHFNISRSAFTTPRVWL